VLIVVVALAYFVASYSASEAVLLPAAWCAADRFIHWSAWKGNFPKYGCSILHSPGPTPISAPTSDRLRAAIIATSPFFPIMPL
jgi:hypothetical protein